MILALVPFALAVKWDCPTFTTPEEAHAFFLSDGDLPVLFDDLETEARTWWDEDCAWTSTTTGYEVEESCTTDAGASVVYTTYAEESLYDTWTWWTLDVALPEGADDWTAMSLTYGVSTLRDASASSETTTWIAAWTGTVPVAPQDDGTFTYQETSSSWAYAGESSLQGDLETSACDWRWSDASDSEGRDAYVAVSTVANSAYVRIDYWDACAPHLYAYLDGALFGAVDSDTWALDEVDRDGWSVDAGDCDDADPTVYPCATEEAVGDGWDQDCDGTDDTDEDGDGHLVTSMGGDDCDDGSPTAYPGAPDPAGDGVDQNCDGADEVDADGDGFTVDGDDGDPDCDDSEGRVRPGANDRPCDGVDQDCDGADLCDTGTVDTGRDTATGDTAAEDTADTAAPVDDDAEGPKEEPTGCASGASALLFLPLVPALARRRKRP